MKRLIPLLLTAALLFTLAGCKASTPSSSTSSAGPMVTEELPLLRQTGIPQLDQAIQALAGAENHQVKITTDRAPGLVGELTVRVTKKLPLELAVALSQTQMTEIEKVPSVKNFNHTLTVQVDGNPYASLEFFLFGEDAPQWAGQMILWVQQGEENRSYLGSAQEFDTLYQMVNAYAETPLVTFDQAQPALLEEPYREDGGRSYLISMVQLGDRLVRHWEAGEESWLDVVNLGNGEILWEQRQRRTSYSLLSLQECFDQDDRNYRVLASDRAFYRDVDDEEDVVTYLLPQGSYLAGYSPKAYAYDLNMREKEMTYRGKDGIYLARLELAPAESGKDTWQLSFKGEPQLVLPNDQLKEAMGDRWQEGMEQEFSPYYDAPRFVDQGRCLVAEMQSPGSQSGLVGLTMLQREENRQTHYTDVFDAMTASVAYPYDSQVVAVGMGRITFIDPQSGEAETHSTILAEDGRWSSAYVTYDYEKFLTEETTRDEEGRSRHTFTLVQLGKTAGDGTTVLTAQGDQITLSALTEGYAFFRFADQEKRGIAALPLP